MTKSIAYALDNTGTIYADVKSCSLNLRVGILQELDEEGDISTRYESEFGFEEYYDDKEPDLNYDYPIIGHKGDKFDNLKFLHLVVERLDDNNIGEFGCLLHSAEEYFQIDKNKAEDVIWLEFDPGVAGENNARCDIRSNFFCLPHPIFFDFTNRAKHFITGDNNYDMTLVVKILSAYQEWLDKPLTVRVSFAYETNPYFSEEQIVKFNKKTRYNEERYAQVIENYINEGLYKSLHKLDEYNNVLVPKSRKWKEEWHSDRIPAEWEKNR